MDPVLPEELVLLQRSVRDFVEQKLAPLEREIEISYRRERSARTGSPSRARAATRAD